MSAHVPDPQRNDPCPSSSPFLEFDHDVSITLYGGTAHERGRRSTVPIAARVGEVMKLSRLASDCLAYLASAGKSKNTLDAYSTAFRQFETHVVHVLGLSDDVKHFTSQHVMSFQVALSQGGMHQNSIRARLSALSRLSKYGSTQTAARGRPIISIDPLGPVERPKRKRPAEKWLQPLELAAFMSVKRPPRIAILRELLVDLSLRVSELCALNWGDLDEANGEVFVSVTVKGDHPVRVPVSRPVAEALHEWYLAQNMPSPDQPIIVDGSGQRLGRGQFAYICKKIGRDAGIRRFPVTPHVLRHTINVIRRQTGLDSTTRSALLTHTNLGSLISYEHLDAAELVPARARQRAAFESYVKQAAALKSYEENARKLWGTRPALEDK